MKITKANLTRCMKIENLSIRKAKLESLALSIGWHGSVWQAAMQEIQRLNELGVKTPLQKRYEESKVLVQE